MSKRLIIERDVPVMMRDGVVLMADIYRPDEPAKFPVLMQRTPYGKGFAGTSFAIWASEFGYAVVIQDTRGRWASGGEDYPFIHEKRDSYDTIEWAARQPWSNGRVGMFGDSYLGYTQMAGAAMQPPSLKAIVPTFTFADAYAIMYQGGALNLGSAVSWSLLTGAHMAVMRMDPDDEQRKQLEGLLIQMVNGLSEGRTFRTLPLEDMPVIGRSGIVPRLVDVLDHPTHDEYWQQVTCDPAQIKTPALHIGGWYDIFTSSTLNDFSAMLAAGNVNQKVIIGPWIHSGIDAEAGSVDFGLHASPMLLLPDEIQIRWFDYWLKEIPNGAMDEPQLRIFVMGDNAWRGENEWPLRRTHFTRYYLHSNGAANTRHGDGSISLESPFDEPVDCYVYDPRNPVPTLGGGLCCWSPALRSGAFDQRPIEERPDVLVYTTPPLQEDLEVTGPIKVHLWASSSAPDTDFTAKLVDVGPCGYARNLQDGILRARFRGGGQPEFLTPGQPYEFIIELGPTSNVFKAGHSLRLEISSSNFPRFDRNLNTTGQPGKTTHMLTALQSIFHDRERASYILLPVIPR